MTNINTRISEVTVYTDRALIIRLGKVTLTGDESELVITGLPLSLQVESVRVKSGNRTGEDASSTAVVKLLDVRAENVFASESFTEKSTQLSRQIRQLEQQKRTIQVDLATCQLQSNFVEGLSEKSLERYSDSLASPQLNLDEIRELLNFLGQQHGEYANAIALRERQLREIDKQLESFIHQFKQLQKPIVKESYSNYNIIVALEPSVGGYFELELSYLVDRVVWVPIYDVQTSSSSKQVHLTYLGEIRQKTGEDWVGVKLTLSTAKLSSRILPTKLEPWYISGKQNDLFPGCNFEENDDDFAELEALLSEDNDPSQPQNLTTLNKQKKFGGTVTFRVEKICTIPSDGMAYKATIISGSYPCRSEYVAIPRLHGFAYLEATIKNSSNAVMLAGKANIFRDGCSMGNVNLDTVEPGERFKLNLGDEENLRIERSLVEREIENIGKYRRITYEYKVSIANLRNQKTTLRVIEQLPMSREEKIKVKLLSTCPEIQLGKMGELQWVVTLPRASKRSGKQELYYRFSVEHPAEISVLSLDI